MNAHARAALTLVRDEARLHWHDAAVWNMRTKRDRAAGAVPDWEALRDAASIALSLSLSSAPGLQIRLSCVQCSAKWTRWRCSWRGSYRHPVTKRPSSR